MRIEIPHHTTKDQARVKVDQKLNALLHQFGGRADDFEHAWQGDTLTFKGKAKGFAVQGTIEVTSDEVIFDGKLPMIAKPFEPRIREAVKREADALFRIA